MFLICLMMMSRNVSEIWMMRYNVGKDGEKFMIRIFRLLRIIRVRNGIFKRIRSLHLWRHLYRDVRSWFRFVKVSFNLRWKVMILRYRNLGVLDLRRLWGFCFKLRELLGNLLINSEPARNRKSSMLKPQTGMMNTTVSKPVLKN